MRDWFIVLKACKERQTLLGELIIEKWRTDSSRPHSSGFQFERFPSPRLVALQRLKSLIYSVLPITRARR